MKDFKFVSANELNKKQLLQIVDLLMEAEYSGNNTISSSFNILSSKHEKLQTIEPYKQYTTVLMSKDCVVGFFIATTKLETKEVSRNISGWRKDEQELASCINFYTHEALNNDFILHDIAIDIKYRGRGFFKLLSSRLFELAKKNNCNRIIFIVRKSNPAVYIYKYYGAKIIGEINSVHINSNDKLVKYYFTVK